MAQLNILRYPDARLHIIAKPVAEHEFDDTLLAFIDDMTHTMYEAPGIGLAATQVDVHKRIILIDISDNQQAPQVFINPVITAFEGRCKWEEGCLSVPGVYEEVERAEKITIKAQDRVGKSFELSTEGLLAICLQHEIDHLDGKVFIEKLSPLKQNRILTKIKKSQHKNR